MLCSLYSMKSMMSRIVDRHDGPMKHAEIILAEDAKRSAMMLELCIQEKIRNGFKPSLQPLLVAAPLRLCVEMSCPGEHLPTPKVMSETLY